MGARRRLVTGAALVALLALGACGSDDEVADSADAPTSVAASTGESATTTVADPSGTEADPAPDPPATTTLHVLVSNDDGIGAPGIDVLVEAVRRLPDTEVTVIAPKDNQSGQGSRATAGALTVAEATTVSGYRGTAVAGFPYDAVVYALDQGGMTTRPHVVLTGINEGANVGPLVDISGTIGAARAAAQRGIPALASSQGLATAPDYAAGATLVLEWLAEHRDALVAGDAPATVTSLNIPTCPTGSIRGEVDVPVATDAGGRELIVSNCESTSPAPVDDVDGFGNGYATFSTVPNAAPA